jgi:hypothetical protein
MSILLELVGLGLVSWGVGLLLGAAAGIICAGLAILFVGSVTDDALVKIRAKRSVARVRYGWWKQVVKENERRSGSPHPPLHVDPEAQAMADRLAAARTERAKVRDRTPALRRYEDNGEDI